jgi:hypothetical protein
LGAAMKEIGGSIWTDMVQVAVVNRTSRSIKP